MRPIELRRYLSILKRRAFLIALTVVVAVIVTGVRTDRTPIYDASTTVYIGANSFQTKVFDPGLSADQQSGLTRLILTFSLLIDSTPVAREALEISGLQRSPAGVVAQTQVVPLPGSNLLRIDVRDTDPTAAQALSIALAEAFVKKISELEPGQPLGEGDLPTAPATIFERASFPGAPQPKDVLPNLFAAALLGFVAAAGVVLLIEFLDITIKTASDAERRLELPVLGVIPLESQRPFTPARPVTSPARS